MIIINSGSELKLTSTPYLGTVLWLACYFGRLSKGKDVTLHPKRKLGCESFQFPSKETPALHLIQITVRRKCLGRYLMCINTGIAFCLKMPFNTVYSIAVWYVFGTFTQNQLCQYAKWNFWHIKKFLTVFLCTQFLMILPPTSGKDMLTCFLDPYICFE